MKLAFAMGNIKVNFENKKANSTIEILHPIHELIRQCGVKYKPLKVYGTKGKRARKEGK